MGSEDPQADLKDEIHDRLLWRFRLDTTAVADEVDPDQCCWLWTGARHQRSGVGLVKVLGHQWPAARVFYWLYEGHSAGFDLADMSKSVMRVGCPNAACVNPAHHEAVPANQVPIILSLLGRARGPSRRVQHAAAA